MLTWTIMLLAVGATILVLNIMNLIGFGVPLDKWFDILFFVSAIALGYRIYMGHRDQKIERLETKIKDLEAVK